MRALALACITQLTLALTAANATAPALVSSRTPRALSTQECGVNVCCDSDETPGPCGAKGAPAAAPDMRFSTLEDLYGDTGNQFRAAVEFFTREATPSTPSGFTGFGVAVDDMVVSWKEFRLDADPGHCAADPDNVCATVTASSGSAFEGSSYVNLTVTDPTPYGFPPQDKNDCNGDGDYTDAANHCFNLANPASSSERSCPNVGMACGSCSASPSTYCLLDADCAPAGGTCKLLVGERCYAPDGTDCNANGTPDVTVKVTTDAPGESTGEIAVLDRVGSSTVYTGKIPYSILYDSPGSLFVVQSGTQPPVVKAFYNDRNGGKGGPCKNSVDPAKQGVLEADTTVTVTTGRVTVNAYKVNLMSTCAASGRPCAGNSDCPTGEGLCYSCSTTTAKPCDPNTTTGTNFCIVATQGTCVTSSPNRGDLDGFADTNETIALSVQFANKSGVDLDDLSATLGTNSPNIECISRSSILVGSLANGALSVPKVCVNISTGVASTTACTTDNDCTGTNNRCGFNYPPFVFKVANVNRTSVSQTLQAPFTVTMRSNKFDALTRATTITLDLDLNVSGTQTSAPFTDDFEQTDFGVGTSKFQRTTLDANKNSLAKSFGYRCQYNDPFGLNSNSVGNTDCFLGFATDPTQGVNDWHIHKSTDGSMGRAFNGVQSAHWGVHPSASSPTLDTYRFKQLDALTTINPVNLPLSSSNPELNFVQQVSFLDNTAGLNVTAGESPDRGVVEVQFASTGLPQGGWIKIYPFVNLYDQQGTDDFADCLFDPVDDGNDEKSFFDPTDPGRRYGPSSTCYPEFNFVRQGQADYRKGFDVNDIGFASDGPGLQGCSGMGCLPANTPAQIFNPGTWVRPRFSLAQFGGRSLRVRFLATTGDVPLLLPSDPFSGPPVAVGDIGWYIDDVHIDQALATSLTLSPDAATINPIPCASCSSIASSLTAALDASPAATYPDGRKRVLPGQVVTLDARASTIQGCLNGVIQYQFWTDGNPEAGVLPDGIVGNAGDNLLRDWSESATLIVSPAKPSWYDYGVVVRCSTNALCAGGRSMILPVVVDCPENRAEFPITMPGDASGALLVSKVNLGNAEPDSNATISWTTISPGFGPVDVEKGDLATLRAQGGRFQRAEISCSNDLTGTSTADATVVPNPGAGYPSYSGFYYLARAGANTGTACNQKPTYDDGSPTGTLLPGRDVAIADGLSTCP